MEGPGPMKVRGTLILLVGVALLTIGAAGKGGKHVDQDRLAERVMAVDQGKEGALEALGANLLLESRENPRAIVRLLSTNDSVLVDRARDLVFMMGETIVEPIIEAAPKTGFADRIWLATVAVRAELVLRRELAASLEGMLAEKAVLPRPEPQGLVEQEPPEVRVCDEAYLQLRKLMHVSEGVGEGVLNADRFLQFDFPRRDRELAEFQESREFRNFMGELEED